MMKICSQRWKTKKTKPMKKLMTRNHIIIATLMSNNSYDIL